MVKLAVLMAIIWNIQVALNAPKYNALKAKLEEIIQGLDEKIGNFFTMTDELLPIAQEKMPELVKYYMVECPNAEGVINTLEMAMKEELRNMEASTLESRIQIEQSMGQSVVEAFYYWRDHFYGDGIAGKVVLDFAETCEQLRDVLRDRQAVVVATIEDFITALCEIPHQAYIANRRTLEIHKLQCEYVNDMNRENKIPLLSFDEVYHLITDEGYNGCHYCLLRYDTDTLTHEQVLANLEDKLKSL